MADSSGIIKKYLPWGVAQPADHRDEPQPEQRQPGDRVRLEIVHRLGADLLRQLERLAISSVRVSRYIEQWSTYNLWEFAFVFVLLLYSCVSAVLDEHWVVIWTVEALLRLLAQLFLSTFVPFQRPRRLQHSFIPSIHIYIPHSTLFLLGVSAVMIVFDVLLHY